MQPSRRKLTKNRGRPAITEEEENCGAWENRTPDILLAKQALYQLS